MIRNLLCAEAKAELEWRKAKKCCLHFLETYVHIEDRDAAGVVIPFSLWPKQKEALQAILENRLVVILKARQLGLTWLALVYALWKMLFCAGYTVVALSKREDDAKELVRRLVFMLRHLPRWLVREKKGAGKNFAGPVWDDTSLSVTVHHRDGEPSVFTSMSSSPDSGRSFTASLVILDEWAFQQWAREIWSAAYPTVNRPTGGQVIGLSTAKRGTLFEEIWDGAPENGFIPVFLPWNADPRRNIEWYEKTKKALPGTYRSEYPSTPEEAFMYAENTVFDIEKVLERKKELEQLYRLQPLLKGNINCDFNAEGDPIPHTEKFTQDTNGYLTIYELPKKGAPYVIGADTAEGGSDFCVAQVIDNTTGKQAATWRGKVDTDIFAKQLFSLGYFYHTALIAVETNFDLHPVKELSRLNYPRQYYREVMDDSTKKKQKKYGFRTTTATRPAIVSRLVAVVRDHIDWICDVQTLSEMLVFIRDDTGKPQAPAGKNDDCVMALAIAYEARGQQSFGSPLGAFAVGQEGKRKDEDEDEDRLDEAPNFYG